jgi:hypothetical protein
MRLIMLTRAMESSAEVLPALTLLAHHVRTMPAEPTALLHAPACDALLVDGRRDLPAVRGLTRLLRQTGVDVPLILITTEGGLAVAGNERELGPTVDRLRSAGIRVSMFIEPEESQIRASAALGAEMVELHTGAFANAQGAAQAGELERIVRASEAAFAAGLQVNAGHGINYENIGLIRTVPHLVDLNIGHSIVSRAVFKGLEAAVSEMCALMAGG